MKQLACFVALVSAGPAMAGDWAQFRGEGGNAAARKTTLPTEFSETKNLVWKIELPGAGASSTIISGDRIYLTAYSGFGVDRSNPGNKEDLKLHCIAIDRKSGKILWNTPIKSAEATQNFGRRVADHGYATATPCTDGERVYASFGVSGLHCFDKTGKHLWKADIGTGTAGFGSASSPIVFGNLVYVNASIESKSLIAFDKTTGKEKWRVDGVVRSWCTPTIAKVGSNNELLLNQKDIIRGFDPETGKELWRVDGIDDYTVPTAVVNDGIAYFLGGRKNRAVAVKLGGRGEVSKTHRLWRVNVGANVTSPVFHEGRLYWLSDRSVANCLDAKTGKTIYQERLPTRERIYPSVVLAGGKIYATTRTKGIFVWNAGPEFKVLATNVLKDEGPYNASPAIGEDNGKGRMYLRTDRHLFCFGE